MDVKGINNQYINTNLVNAYKSNKININSAKPSQPTAISDKLEISSEAKKLKGQGMDKAKLSEVKNKINNGFYNSETVLNKVVDEIYKEISS